MNIILLYRLYTYKKIQSIICKQLQSNSKLTLKLIKKEFPGIVNKYFKVIEIKYISAITSDKIDQSLTNITVNRLFSDFSLFIKEINISNDKLNLILLMKDSKMKGYASIEDFFRFLFELDCDLSKLDDERNIIYVNNKNNIVVDYIRVCGIKYSFAYNYKKDILLIADSFGISSNNTIKDKIEQNKILPLKLTDNFLK